MVLIIQQGEKALSINQNPTEIGPDNPFLLAFPDKPYRQHD